MSSGSPAGSPRLKLFLAAHGALSLLRVLCGCHLLSVPALKLFGGSQVFYLLHERLRGLVNGLRRFGSGDYGLGVNLNLYIYLFRRLRNIRLLLDRFIAGAKTHIILLSSNCGGFSEGRRYLPIEVGINCLSGNLAFCFARLNIRRPNCNARIAPDGPG